MSACTITGTATITRFEEPDGTGHLVWTEADPAIHVSDELLHTGTPEGVAFLTDKYEIGEWCPHEPHTRHARRKDTL